MNHVGLLHEGPNLICSQTVQYGSDIDDEGKLIVLAQRSLVRPLPKVVKYDSSLADNFLIQKHKREEGVENVCFINLPLAQRTPYLLQFEPIVEFF